MAIPVTDHEKEQCIRNIIHLMGDSPNRPELKDTPSRVLKSYQEMFAGYKMKPEDILKVFEVSGILPYGHKFKNEMITQSGIPFVSFCEHHLLPFFGSVSISYTPTNQLRVGLSKLTRLVECFSKRLQVQERMTNQIANALFQSGLIPKFVSVNSTARHMCMECRGVEKEASTSCNVSLSVEEATQDFSDIGTL